MVPTKWISKVTVRRRRVGCAARRVVARYTGRVNRLTAELRVGRIQPLGPGGGVFGVKVSFQPLGVSCQMSLLGWLGNRCRMSWR